MKLKHLLIGMLAFVAAVSCKEDQPVEAPTLKVSKTSLSFAAEGGEASFTITTNKDWTATPDADWVNVETTSGKASAQAITIKVTAEENTASEARTATIKVKAGNLNETINVTQAEKVATEPEPEPEVPAIAGTGTEADPYQIATAEDLAKIATLAKVDAATYFKMTADVDMAAVEYVPTDSLAMVHFDGDNHTVANLKTPLFGTCVTCKNLTVTGSEVAPTFVSGLLAQVIGATDVPATLTNVKVQGKITAAAVNYLGGFAGKSVSDLNMTDCSADVTIESSGSSVAGLIGASQAVLNMTNCSVTGTVKGKGNIGGLVGNKSKGGDVVNCFNKSEVVATGNSVGGIAGNCTGGHIENSYNEGNIAGVANVGGIVGNSTDVLNYSKCYSKCNVTTSGAQYGGVIGALKSSDNATMVKVTECWYSGNIKCTKELNCGGGIVGRAYTPAEVTKCWSEGDINAYTNIGGIIGYSNCALTVANCYSTMSLNSNGGQSAGGIMGSPNPSGAYLKIENCYATGTIQGKCALGGVVAMIQIDAIPDNFEFTLKNCVYWGTSITTNTTDPTNYSSGAIFGNIRDAKKDHASKMVSNIVDNFRNPAMTLSDYQGKYPDATNGPVDYYNPLVDNDNCVGQGVLPPYLVPQDQKYKNDWAKMAYHGKAAAAGATVSSLAKAAGWDETVWDLSADLPVFKK